MDKTTVLIADDHPLLRDGLVHLLMKETDLEVVGQASDGEEVVRLVDETTPDVVVMDIEMPKIDGLDATRQIRTTHPETSVLVLTAHDDEEYVSALLDAGAAGYLLKTTYGKELIQAIRAVHLGEFILDTRIGPKVFSAFARRSSHPVSAALVQMLSDRETELAKLVGRGMTNEEISQEIGVSLRAVKSHLSDIFSKLGVSSRMEAITACLRAGVLSLDDISPR